MTPKLFLPLALLSTFTANAKLAAWYPLDEPSSATASENILGNGANLIGPDFIAQGHPSASSVLGTSYLLAKGGALNLGSNTSVQPTDQFTISFFYQPGTFDAFDRILESQNTNTNAQNGIRIDAGGTGNRVRVLIRSNAAANTQLTHPTDLKNDGTWYFCAVRYDSTLGDGSALKLTVVELNGTPIDEAAITAGTSEAAVLNTGSISQPHAIETILGSENLEGTGANTLNAALDEFAFYDNSDNEGVLTDIQLADGANFGPSGVEIITSFTTDSGTASAGNPATLSWSINEPFDSLTLIDNQGGTTDLGPLTNAGSGTTTVAPTESTTYYLRGVSGEAANVHVLKIISGAAPEIVSFTASRPIVTAGGEVDLIFGVNGAETLTLDPGGIDVTSQTSTTLTVSETTTFTLNATNSFGTTSEQLIVTATSGPIPAHSYNAATPTNTLNLWQEPIANRTMNLTGLSLDSPLALESPNTNISATYRSDGGPTGGSVSAFQFIDASFEIWFRPADITTDHQVIFETGGGQNGISVLLSENGLRFIGSSLDVRTLDEVVSLDGVDFSDFVQVIFSVGTETDTFAATVRDTTGMVLTTTATGDVSLGGNGATSFNWGAGAIGLTENNLGGRTEAADASPEGLSPFAGEIAIINVYDSFLSEAETEAAFQSVATGVTPGSGQNTITSISSNGTDQVTLTWNSRDGVTYDVEISGGLRDWAPLEQTVTATGSETTKDFDVTPGQAKSFFRIIEVSP
ncbi:MAG: LamG-like jellyroll fold domain-containing protein [Akkermansiaceae bacterium]